MQSSSLALVLMDADDRGQLGGPGIPKAWSAFLITIGFLIWYFPHNIAWASTADWVICPINNIYADLAWCAKLLADKIEGILGHPDYDEDELRAIFAYLVELIRWLRRLNLCYSIVVAQLHRIHHWTYDASLYNHEQCGMTLTRLIEYAYILDRRFDINVVDGALG